MSFKSVKARISSRADNVFYLSIMKAQSRFFKHELVKKNIFRVRKIVKWSEISKISTPDSKLRGSLIKNINQSRRIVADPSRFIDNWHK